MQSIQVVMTPENLSLSLIQLFHTEISNSSHNGLPFSTFDVDNDNREGDFAERSCARLYKVSRIVNSYKMLNFISITFVRRFPQKSLI